jgi:hypothetical protein
MKKEIIELNISEYLAYMLLYATNADFETGRKNLKLSMNLSAKRSSGGSGKHLMTPVIPNAWM